MFSVFYKQRIKKERIERQRLMDGLTLIRRVQGKLNKATEYKQEAKQNDASVQRLLSERSKHASGEHDRKRLFQVIADSLYPPLSRPQENKLILHCNCLRDGLGDVAQVLSCADMIKANRPCCDITVVIEADSEVRDKIRNIFNLSNKQYKVVFANEIADQGKKVDGYPLGIAVSASLDVLEKLTQLPQFVRTLREYGFGEHCDTKREPQSLLSMGLQYNEEGINFPGIQARTWKDIQSPWLKDVIDPKRKVYCQYLKTSSYKLAAIYAVAALENKNEVSIDIFMSIECSLKELLDRRVLDAELLKKHGIGKVVLVKKKDTKEDVEMESILIGDKGGKELRIISGTIPKSDMEVIQQKSEPFYGCTGDMSLSEGLVLNKVIFYEAVDHKIKFLEALVDVARERKFERVAKFLELLQTFNAEEMKVINETKYFEKGKKIGGHMGTWACAILDIFNKRFGSLKVDSDIPSRPPSFTPQSKGPVDECLQGIVKAAVQFAEELVKFCLDPLFVQEMQKFDKDLRENYDVKSRLLANVNRGVFLQNHPEVFEVEEELRKDFVVGKVTEDQVREKLSAAIQAALTPRLVTSTALRC